MQVEVTTSDIHRLGTWLRRFLCEHIVTERNLARNTQQSYRDAFTLLLPFVSRVLGKPVDRLAVRDLTAGRVLQFLAYLENDRGCSVQTATSAWRQSVPSPVLWAAAIRCMSNGAAVSVPSGPRKLRRNRWSG